MTEEQLTEKQRKILEEIHELVKIGEQKLKEIDDEMAKIEEKWRQRAKIKNLS